MKFFASIARRFVCVLTLVLCGGGVLAATDEKPAAVLNLKSCWQFDYDSPTAIQPAADGERVIAALPGGSLLALNAADGATLWRSDLGGEVIGQIHLGAAEVFVATQTNGDKGARISMRGLSLTTGVTIWRNELPDAVKIELTTRGDTLLALIDYENEADALTAVKTQSGEVVWTRKLSGAAASGLAASENQIYLTTTDKFIQILSLADGSERRRFALPLAPGGKIAPGGGGILFLSDAAGRVTALRETDGKKLWSIRIGGAVQHILPVADAVLLTSLDNFVYFHSSGSGKRRWRKRLAGRALGANLINGDAVLLLTAGETSGVIANLKKGKTIGQASFGADNFAVAAPVSAAGRIFIAANRNLQSFVGDAAACSTK